MRGEEAVSSVVGTVLMLSVTVAAFAGLGYMVLREFDQQPVAPRADLAVAQESSSVLLVQQGGESVPLAGARVLVNVGGSEQETAVSAIPGAGALGPTLDLGEALCIQGPDPARCLYPTAQEIRGVILVTGGFVLAQVGDRGDPSLPLPQPPDLTVGSLTWSPPSPVAPEAVTFSAVVTNIGGETPGPVAVAFRLDGALLGTVQITGPFAAGASAVVASPAWTATAGSHTATATVDPSGTIAETLENNNAVAAALSAAAGVADPGFPYADANGDGLYTVGTDSPIATSAVTDGAYACAAGMGLTVPPSVGAITAPTIDIACDGAVTLHVGLTSTSGAFSVVSGGNLWLLPGSTLSSAGAMTLAPQGKLFGNGTMLVARADLDIGDPSSARAGASFYLNDAAIDATPGSGDVSIQLLGTLDLTDASVRSDGDILVGGYSNANQAQAVLLSGAFLDTRGGAGAIDLHDLGSVSGAGSTAQLRSLGAIGIDAALNVDLSQATLDNSGGSQGIAVSGASLTFSGATVRTNGAVDLLGSGTTTCNACTVAGGAAVTITGSGGTMDVRNSVLTTVNNRDLKLTVGTGFQVLVDGATFQDRNNRADITPNGAASGTPLSGGVE